MKQIRLSGLAKIPRALKKAPRMILLIFMCVLIPTAPAAADEEAQKNYEVKCIMGAGCALYDPNACSDSIGTIGAGGNTIGSDVTGGLNVRATGVQPPYMLEEWAIEVLRSVAIKRTADENSTITEEHVIALLAFAKGEGGDIANRWKFNPLNTGLNAPELIDGQAQNDGTQGFKSFDAGVEAAARTIVGGNQSRLADKLLDKNSTASQFMEALTFFNNYPGNKFWAAASLPPNAEKYYRQRQTLVQQVRSKYSDFASLQIGTDKLEEIDNIHVPLDPPTAGGKKLRFKPAGDVGLSGDANTPAGGASGCNTNSVGIAAGDIVRTALGLAWPNINPSHIIYASENADGGRSKATPAYQEALPKYNGSKGIREYSDCGVYVATVIHAAGVDPNYPKRGTSTQKPYLEANQDKYQIIQNPRSTAELQPGDILIKEGHTYLYTGNYTGDDGKQYNSAAASLALTTTGHAPEAEHWYPESGYIAARLIKK